jgi:hypothetical protein
VLSRPRCAVLAVPSSPCRAGNAALPGAYRLPGRPVCEYRNGCIARFGGKPIDCYVEPIRIQKNRMLRQMDQA